MNIISHPKILLKTLLIKLLRMRGLVIVSDDTGTSESLQTRIYNSFLEVSEGVIHIGAHKGQEADFYNLYSANVIWIEALPEIYEELLTKISFYPKQKAIQALVGDSNLENVTFHVASNDAQSSSLYEFGSELGFENLEMTSSLRLPMVRLDTILSEEDIAGFSHWVLDVQGAELKVLLGSGSLLDSCKSIYIEVSTREIYQSGVQYGDLKDFLKAKGFHPLWEPADHSHTNILFFRFRQ